MVNEGRCREGELCVLERILGGRRPSTIPIYNLPGVIFLTLDFHQELLVLHNFAMVTFIFAILTDGLRKTVY